MTFFFKRFTRGTRLKSDNNTSCIAISSRSEMKAAWMSSARHLLWVTLLLESQNWTRNDFCYLFIDCLRTSVEPRLKGLLKAGRRHERPDMRREASQTATYLIATRAWASSCSTTKVPLSAYSPRRSTSKQSLNLHNWEVKNGSCMH